MYEDVFELHGEHLSDAIKGLVKLILRAIDQDDWTEEFKEKLYRALRMAAEIQALLDT